MAAGLLYSAARRLVAYDDKENAVAALRSLSPRRPNYKEWVRRARSSIPELQCQQCGHLRVSRLPAAPGHARPVPRRL